MCVACLILTLATPNCDPCSLHILTLLVIQATDVPWDMAHILTLSVTQATDVPWDTAGFFLYPLKSMCIPGYDPEESWPPLLMEGLSCLLLGTWTLQFPGTRACLLLC